MCVCVCVCAYACYRLSFKRLDILKVLLHKGAVVSGEMFLHQMLVDKDNV